MHALGFRILFIAITTGFLSTCSTNLPYAEEDSLKRPYQLAAVAASSESIRLSYMVTNTENTFTGYNVYISQTSIPDSYITSRVIVPYLTEGSQPSVRHTSDDFNTSQSKTLTIDFLRYGIIRLNSGETYYIRMSAYSYNKVESLPSPEVKVVLP